MHLRTVGTSLALSLSLSAIASAQTTRPAAPPGPAPAPQMAPQAPPGSWQPAPAPYYYPTVAPAPTERTANNALYVELLGPGLFYSLNYERNFSDFAGRIGISYFSLTASSSSSGDSASASLITVPLTVSYLGIGNKKHIFELGAGIDILHAGAGTSTLGVESNDSATKVYALGVFGYRLQPLDGGFFLRAGLAPIIGGGLFLPWPYLGLGATF